MIQKSKIQKYLNYYIIRYIKRVVYVGIDYFKIIRNRHYFVVIHTQNIKR